MRTAEEIRYLILAAQREGNRLLARELRPLGITPAQAEALRLLKDEHTLSLAGLGELLVCESGTSPSRLVDRLVAAGLVRREVAKHDRRHVELSLTAEGARVARGVTRVEDDLYQFIDAALAGRDTAEISGFLWAFVADQPTGQALLRRKERQEP